MKACKELIRMVDREIEALQQKLSLLEEMERCVHEGAATKIEELLQKQASLQQDEDTELSMRQHCCAMAADLGIPPGQVTLGRLAEALEGPDALALQDRRERLLVVTQKLQEKSTATAFLVRRVLEAGERVLAAMIGDEGAGETYSAGGSVERHRQGIALQHSV